MLLNKLTDVVQIIPEVRQNLSRQRILKSCRMITLVNVVSVFHNSTPVITKSIR